MRNNLRRARRSQQRAARTAMEAESARAGGQSGAAAEGDDDRTERHWKAEKELGCSAEVDSRLWMDRELDERWAVGSGDRGRREQRGRAEPARRAEGRARIEARPMQGRRSGEEEEGCRGLSVS